MTARTQWIIVLSIIALLGGALATVTLDEAAVERTLDDYRGDVVLLNVWATWCGPCEAEMPSMQRLHESYADSGLRIVAVSIDDPGSEETIRAFVQRYGLTFD